MNNPVLKFLKFSSVFIISTGGMLFLYYKFNTTDYDKLALLLTPGKNKAICTEAPENSSYSNCIKRYIAQLVEKASPFELLKVPTLIREVKEQDLFHKPQNKMAILHEYLVNQKIFFENLRYYTLSRNRYDYFQILIRPAIGFFLKKELSKIRREALEIETKELDKDEAETLQFILQLKLKT